MAGRVEEQGLRILERQQRVKERVKDRLPKNLLKVEARIARLEQRVKRIEEHPDPSKPAANRLLYKMEANGLRRLREAWTTGNPPFAATMGAPTGAMGLMGWGGIGAADRSTPEEAKRYFNIMERLGFNSNSCDRTTAIIPMVMTGEYPPPDFISASNLECFPIYQSYQSLGRLLGIPVLSIDRPQVFDERALAYVTCQIREEIDYLQTIFPGHEYNEDILIEQYEVARIWWGYHRDIYQLSRRKPCPIAGIESFRAIGPPSGEDQWGALEYARIYRDQLYEKADKGDVPCKVWGTEEKLRLLWAVSGPFYYDAFTFLDKLGVSVPCWHITSQTEKLAGRERVEGDEAFGRKLSPLEEKAMLMKLGWGERSDYYVDSILATCQDLELDGIVYFKQTGCAPTMPLAGVVSDRAERELGIPTLELEERQLDQRGFNERALLSKLVDFCNICLTRKHLPALTKKEVEKAGYPQ